MAPQPFVIKPPRNIDVKGIAKNVAKSATLKYLTPILTMLGFALALIFFVIIFATAFISDLAPTQYAGFKSGSPTAFANNDIPPEFMPIFQRAQEQYGVSWAVLAAIARTESTFGQDMSTSSAGAIGFMQFMPSTWEAYKQDGNHDGIYDPYDPWDAVFSAANYLKANGFEKDPEKAIYAYNHAGWYVRKVMDLASAYASTMTPLGTGTWPLPKEYTYISSPYGMRYHPIDEENKFHDGIDLPAPTGTPVFAVSDGKVDWNQFKGAYGLTVVLNHGTHKTTYAHLSDIAVKSGVHVNAGEVIGYVGSTGKSTGPHLHFSVYVNDQPTNPEEWLQIPSGNY